MSKTIQALKLAGLLDTPQLLKIADIGCGTGASTLVLAKKLNATITAVDLFQDFLDVSIEEAGKRGLENTFDGFIAKYDSDDAQAIVEAEKAEIALYKKHQNYYSYGFYIAQKI